MRSLALLLIALPIAAEEIAPSPRVRSEGGVPLDFTAGIPWRPIGPAIMGGRITGLAVHPKDTSTYWVATASAGLLQTTNAGFTYSHQFDHETVASLGAVAVAPSDPKQLWVGTGEANPRNSVSFGDGVYKSVDSGATWKKMGLPKSFQIGKIVVHPTDPNIVYVGVLGRLYGPNPERGLYRTIDGGKTWDHLLFVNDATGVIDIAMHPTDPKQLLVATWERKRDAFDSFRGDAKPPPATDSYAPAVTHGAGSGLYRSTDGKTFEKVTAGLPPVKLGRIGLDFSRSEPNVVYAIIDSEEAGKGLPPSSVYFGIVGAPDGTLTSISKDSPAEKAGLLAGDKIVKFGDTAIDNYEALVSELKQRMPNEPITVRFLRGKAEKTTTVTLVPRAASKGKTPPDDRPYAGQLGGNRMNVQKQQGPDGDRTGGVYRSTDAGKSWKRVNSHNPRPFYFSVVRVDPTNANNLYVLGVNLSQSVDGGKTFSEEKLNDGLHSDQHDLWIDPANPRHLLCASDGGIYVSHNAGFHWDHHNHVALGQFYHVDTDDRLPYRVYGGLQDNGSWGGPAFAPKQRGPVNDDWDFVNGGDGFQCQVDVRRPEIVYAESQDGSIMRRNLRTGESKAIRPKLAKDVKKDKEVKNDKEAPLYRFNWNTPLVLSVHDGATFYAAGNVVFRSRKDGDDLRVLSPELCRTKRGSATALAESPRDPEILWAGTDDGAVWVTRDGGKSWKDVTDNLLQVVPGLRWVASIDASRAVEGRAYVALDGHRSDDDAPYVLVTEDFGNTWKSLRGNLPVGSTHVLREDITQPNLLYAGTEFGLYGSIDRGNAWFRMNGPNLPTVPVYALAQPTSVADLVVGTHGRSIWIGDVSALRQATSFDSVTLYTPEPAVKWFRSPGRTGPFAASRRQFVGVNPEPGAAIDYYLPATVKEVRAKITDVEGKLVREFVGLPTQPGLHRFRWNFDGIAPPVPKGAAPKPTPVILPGSYRVSVSVDGVERSKLLRFLADPTAPAEAAIAVDAVTDADEEVIVDDAD